MEPYVPEFDNPYPKREWSQITDFRYDTPLVLYRGIEAVKKADGRDADYISLRPYTIRYRLDGDQHSITVPPGMLTDLASVPRAGRWLIGRVGPHLEASIVHDFLYIAWQDIPGYGAREDDRAFADELFRVGMKQAKVSGFKKAMIYRAVRWFGGGTYKRRDTNRYVRIPGEETETITSSTGEAVLAGVLADP